MRKARHIMGWTNWVEWLIPSAREVAFGMAAGLRRRALLLAAVCNVAALGAAGMALAQPEPPTFEARVLERLRPLNGFRDDQYRVWVMSDDGTVYGTVTEDNVSWSRHEAVKSRIGVGTVRFLRAAPNQVEVNTVAASTSGVALILSGYYIHIPDFHTWPLIHLHPEQFYANDMNNLHEIVGMVGVSPRNRAVIYRYRQGFEYLEESQSSAVTINDSGTVIGHMGGTPTYINMRVWYRDGRRLDFVLPSTNGTGGSFDLNEANEACGIHHRRDSTNDSRWAGWFWSERTGLVEIPFRYEYPIGGFDVNIYGISDDGWVLGKEHFRSGQGHEYFLWHVDAGFFDLGDLYPWEGRFQYPADGHDGAINGVGQVVVPTYSLQSQRTVYVFLNPSK